MLRALIAVVAVAVAGVVWFLLWPVADVCDEPRSLVLCSVRTTPAGLAFEQAAAPSAIAVLVTMAIVVAVGALLTWRLPRRRTL